ncbi:peptidoglycan-associated lipoprotein Pal [Zoogloea sp.]|uniref:peptidoglycan-associated lipoprotein Pal n=1 Tax=Zoogloea sp. TaxID=49181 RepID=UPI0035B1D178
MKFQNIALSLLATALLAACSSTPKTEGAAAVEDRTAPSADAGRVVPVTTDTPKGAVYPELTDPKSVLSKRVVLFDFDSYSIKSEYRPLVEAHAKFLVAHPNVKMLIQGNTDARGSTEYNLALGQKRSEAVKKALGLLGVSEAQLEAVSLGKEKPTCAESTEACWAANRRGEMLYSGEF